MFVVEHLNECPYYKILKGLEAIQSDLGTLCKISICVNAVRTCAISVL